MEIADSPTFKGNGMALDNDGNILVCEQVSSCLVRLRRGGGRDLVAFHYQGKYLNSPNDVVTRGSDGSIYFTDPDYGRWNDWIGQERSRDQLGFRGLYRVPPGGGELELVVDGGRVRRAERPLLLAATRRCSTSTTPPHATSRCSTSPPTARSARAGSLHEGIGIGVSSTRATSTGWSATSYGNVWVTGPGGVWVLTPEGDAPRTSSRRRRSAAAIAWGGDGPALAVPDDDDLRARRDDTGRSRAAAAVLSRRPDMPELHDTSLEARLRRARGRRGDPASCCSSTAAASTQPTSSAMPSCSQGTESSMPSSAAPRGGPRSSPCSSSGWDHNRRGRGQPAVHLIGNPAVTRSTATVQPRS